MDVAVAIDAESIPAVLRVRGTGSFDNRGNAIPGDVVETNIRITAQPASGRALLDLPEGLRSEVSDLVWSREALGVNVVLVYDGEQHRVIHVWPRRRDGFTRAAVRRLT